MLYRNADLARLANVKGPNLYRDFTLPKPDEYLVGDRVGVQGPPVYTEATVIAWCEANGIGFDLGRVMK